MWKTIIIIICSSFILSIDDLFNIPFSMGSISIVITSICWGFENNCTRKLSKKNTCEIVTIKGLCCGTAAIVISMIIEKQTYNLIPILLAIGLGYIAYGLSILFYIKAQKHLGASKTSAYYAVVPFIGALLSAIFLNEILNTKYFIGLGLMLLGSIIITIDTLLIKNRCKDSLAKKCYDLIKLFKVKSLLLNLV